MPFLAVVLGTLLFALLAAPAQGAVVWAVGDGGVSGPRDDAVAARIQREGVERFLYLGDVYETGTAAEFRDNYHPSFGRFKSISSPTIGNHEWDNRAAGYDPYWGSRAPRTNGGHYYSFDFAGWHFVSMNTESDMSAGSPQVAWLKGDLARYSGTCTIAFWHRPRFSSGPHTRNNSAVEPLYAAIAGRSVALLSGHDHNYQRMKPERGVTQWVVGTGGRETYDTDESDARLAYANDESDGALRMDLQRGRMTYEFVTPTGARLDSGSLTCRPHDADAPSPTPTPTPSPSPTPGPGPGPGSGPSGGGGSGTDGATPTRARVGLRHPRGGRTYSRRLRRLRGTASVPAGAVLQLSLTHRRGGVCRSWDGRRFRRASCKRPPLFRPAGASQWSVRLGSRPRAGRYRLTARVRSSRGVLARAAASFRIR